MNDELEHEEEEESTIKRDKIFENTYEETEMDSHDITFTIDPSLRQKSFEMTIDEELIFNKFDDIVKNTKFEAFTLMDGELKFKKLNKRDINEVYSFATTKLHREPNIEIFSVICSYFDISPEKFYESLSNSFKTELITDLKSRGYLDGQKSLF
tara:strand:+ start:1963 stop:2424 length:462 start_codon:yes stop_codon:yes gene_type:complete